MYQIPMLNGLVIVYIVLKYLCIVNACLLVFVVEVVSVNVVEEIIKVDFLMMS